MKQNKLSKLKVLYDYILVKPEKENKEVDGVIMPKSYEEKPAWGEVMAIGEGRLFENGKIIPLKVIIGNFILFQRYSATPIDIDGVGYLILREDDIIAVKE